MDGVASAPVSLQPFCFFSHLFLRFLLWGDSDCCHSLAQEKRFADVESSMSSSRCFLLYVCLGKHSRLFV